MEDVFLSYSRKDRSRVEELKLCIESHGYSVWLDTDDIRAGHLWRSQIVEGIEKCRLYIVMLTTNSIISDNVRRELDLARAKHKQMLPVYAEPKPTHLSRDMEYQLVGLQAVQYEDLFKETSKGLLDELMRTPETLTMPLVEVAIVAVLQHERGDAVPLLRESYLVGRGPGADIDLTPWDHARFVSQRHAELQYRDGSWELRTHEGASNPTLINSNAVPKQATVKLANGDRVTFANVTFRFIQGQ